MYLRFKLWQIRSFNGRDPLSMRFNPGSLARKLMRNKRITPQLRALYRVR